MKLRSLLQLLVEKLQKVGKTDNLQQHVNKRTFTDSTHVNKEHSQIYRYQVTKRQITFPRNHF